VSTPAPADKAGDKVADYQSAVQPIANRRYRNSAYWLGLGQVPRAARKREIQFR
jgi:hypothetical protein